MFKYSVVDIKDKDVRNDFSKKESNYTKSTKYEWYKGKNNTKFKVKVVIKYVYDMFESVKDKFPRPVEFESTEFFTNHGDIYFWAVDLKEQDKKWLLKDFSLKFVGTN